VDVKAIVALVMSFGELASEEEVQTLEMPYPITPIPGLLFNLNGLACYKADHHHKRCSYATTTLSSVKQHARKCHGWRKKYPTEPKTWVEAVSTDFL
jgi:hypothetical protein